VYKPIISAAEVLTGSLGVPFPSHLGGVPVRCASVAEPLVMFYRQEDLLLLGDAEMAFIASKLGLSQLPRACSGGG